MNLYDEFLIRINKQINYLGHCIAFYGAFRQEIRKVKLPKLPKSIKFINFDIACIEIKTTNLKDYKIAKNRLSKVLVLETEDEKTTYGGYFTIYRTVLAQQIYLFKLPPKKKVKN